MDTDNYDDPDMFWQTDLLGSHFAYDLDLSQVGCSCNAAAYFTQMPGYKPDSSGRQVPYKGPIGTWYCDANDRNNNWCPEYDLIEANMYTI